MENPSSSISVDGNPHDSQSFEKIKDQLIQACDYLDYLIVKAPFPLGYFKDLRDTLSPTWPGSTIKPMYDHLLPLVELCKRLIELHDQLGCCDREAAAKLCKSSSRKDSRIFESVKNASTVIHVCENKPNPPKYEESLVVAFDDDFHETKPRLPWWKRLCK